MLNITRTGDVLEVEEVLHGFFDTKRTYFYFDVVRNMKSSNGRKGDVPDRPMHPSEIKWCKEHYIPKTKLKGF